MSIQSSNNSMHDPIEILSTVKPIAPRLDQFQRTIEKIQTQKTTQTTTGWVSVAAALVFAILTLEVYLYLHYRFYNNRPTNPFLCTTQNSLYHE